MSELPFIPYARASIGDEEIDEVVATLKSGWLTMGPRTRKFEEEFAVYAGVPFAVAVNSCTSALFLLLHSLGIGPGDEVITAPLTFAASANVIVHTGAKPVLADVSRDGWSLDPQRFADAVTEKTKAVVVVHYAGATADMAAIERIAGERIAIVEDAAHASGARYRDTGARVGSRQPAAFSFYATKNMTTGEGGMITLRDQAVAARLRSLRLHGISQDAWKRYSAEGSWYYEVNEHGFKMNSTDINSALGLHQLRKLDAFNDRRRAICRRYDAAFADLPVELPAYVSEETAAAHLYSLLVHDPADRDPLFAHLREAKVGTGLHFIPLNLMPAFQKNYGYRKGDFPNAESFYERTVALPLYPSLTEEEIDRVISGVRGFFVKG